MKRRKKRTVTISRKEKNEGINTENKRKERT